MANLILSLYRVFFIDENNSLWALFHDGRLSYMKQVPSFCSFSSDHTVLTGVEMDGRQTHIKWMFADFKKQQNKKIISCLGYCYFPVLWNTTNGKIACIKADLLNPNGMGQLQVYQKARKRYHKIESFQAAMYPPAYGKSGALYYVSKENNLLKKIGDTTTLVYPKASLFAITEDEEELAVYSEETIQWISTRSGRLRQFIAFDVSAIGFDQKGDCLYFATHKHGRTGLYQYNKYNQEINLILNHSAKITAISF